MVASVTRAVLPIATERLLLRPFAADDADALHAIRSQPEVVRYLYEGPMSHAEAVEVARRRGGETALEEEGDKLSLAMELRATGELAGDLVLILTSVAHRQGEVGYTLHPGHQGRGLATEGARAILALGFGSSAYTGSRRASTGATPRRPGCSSASGCAARRTCARTSGSRASGRTSSSTRCSRGSGAAW
jgi:RimJ/RimL family protein N-acetyltransferase